MGGTFRRRKLRAPKLWSCVLEVSWMLVMEREEGGIYVIGGLGRGKGGRWKDWHAYPIDEARENPEDVLVRARLELEGAVDVVDRKKDCEQGILRGPVGVLTVSVMVREGRAGLGDEVVGDLGVFDGAVDDGPADGQIVDVHQALVVVRAEVVDPVGSRAAGAHVADRVAERFPVQGVGFGVDRPEAGFGPRCATARRVRVSSAGCVEMERGSVEVTRRRGSLRLASRSIGPFLRLRTGGRQRRGSAAVGTS